MSLCLCFWSTTWDGNMFDLQSLLKLHVHLDLALDLHIYTLYIDIIWNKFCEQGKLWRKYPFQRVSRPYSQPQIQTIQFEGVNSVGPWGYSWDGGLHLIRKNSLKRKGFQTSYSSNYMSELQPKIQNNKHNWKQIQPFTGTLYIVWIYWNAYMNIYTLGPRNPWGCYGDHRTHQ